MSTLTNSNVLIDGSRVAYGAIGEGEPVILIHGTPSSSYIWRNIAPKLVYAGYKAYVFDLLGFGASERPYDPAVDTSVTGQVPILKSLIRHWGLQHAHIVAHDIGGAVAQRFCIFHKHVAKSLTMIDVVSFDSWPSKRTLEQMQTGLEHLIKAPDDKHREHFGAWLHSAVQNKDRFSKTALGPFLDLIAGPIGQGSLFQHQIMHYHPKHTEEIAARYHELAQVPVQLIWGADDAWQNVDWAHRLNDAIPGSELHLLENCGHFAMEDQPEKISALLIDFLNRQS